MGHRLLALPAALRPAALLPLFAALLLAAGSSGCGSSDGCQTASCSAPSTKTFQICSSADTTVVAENYGSSSCEFDTEHQSSTGSVACAQAVGAWCQGASGGGAGGGSAAGAGGGSAGGAGGGASCPTQGQSCTPANLCDLGAIACDEQGAPACADSQQPNLAENGVACASGSVCHDGACLGCSQGAPCAPTANPCNAGTLDCSSGLPVCRDSGSPNPGANGQSCDGGVCANGTCSACTSGASCSPPANPCDLGTLSCGASGATCVDTNTVDSAQEGQSCGAGRVCQGGVCIDTGSSANGWPLVPDQGGDPVISTPHLVLITYTNDTNQTALDGYGTWIAGGGYIEKVAGEYGVNNGSVEFVQLDPAAHPAPTGTSTNQNAFPDYLTSLFTAQVLPAYAYDNIYALVIPSSWSDTTSFCQTAGGYHTYYIDGQNHPVVYAVVPNCLGTNYTAQQQLTQIEVALSHEIIEASTDPLVDAYQIQSMSTPWFYLGGEVGDLCASNETYYQSGNYSAQLIWSNKAVAAGQVPCQPWSAASPYFSLVGPTTMASGAPGSSVNISITGWASAPSIQPIYLYAQDGDYYVDFASTPTLSAQQVLPSQSVTVTLHIPSTAQPGQHGAAWILAEDSLTGVYQGSTMVAVTVQ